MVREFERQETRRLAIVVDASADAGEGLTPLDRCCSVAASVAFAASGRGQGVRLVTGTGGAPEVLHRAEPRDLLRRLAELRPSGGPDLGMLLGELGSELVGADTVVVTLPTWHANAVEGLADAVGELRGQAASVVAVLVEAHTFPGVARKRTLGPPEVEELEDALEVRGVLTCRVGAEDDLAAALGRLPAGALR